MQSCHMFSPILLKMSQKILLGFISIFYIENCVVCMSVSMMHTCNCWKFTFCMRDKNKDDGSIRSQIYASFAQRKLRSQRSIKRICQLDCTELRTSLISYMYIPIHYKHHICTNIYIYIYVFILESRLTRNLMNITIVITCRYVASFH